MLLEEGVPLVAEARLHLVVSVQALQGGAGDVHLAGGRSRAMNASHHEPAPPGLIPAQTLIPSLETSRRSAGEATSFPGFSNANQLVTVCGEGSGASLAFYTHGNVLLTKPIKLLQRGIFSSPELFRAQM